MSRPCRLFSLTPIAGALLLAGNLSSLAYAEPPADITLAPVQVNATTQSEPSSEQTRNYLVKKSNTATGLSLSPRQTPQSISVVTRAQMDDFGLNSANDVLENTAGVLVEKVETDRTYYISRGFDITNFQIDGIGTPFTSGNVYGDIDTAIYDRVETLRGANGLLSATGNPSATVNFVRKRPTDTFQSSAKLTAGSWNLRRADVDVSGPINTDGSVRARLVAAQEESDSWLDRYSREKTVLHGVVEVDLNDTSMLTIGHSRQQNKTKGTLWGALPLYYTDGTPTHFDTSASTAADWSYWDTTKDRSFIELSQQLNPDWQSKVTLTRIREVSDSKLFYVYGTPDRTTGLGLYAYPSQYGSENVQNIADASVSGKFMLGGRQHAAAFGLNWSRSQLDDISLYGTGIGTALPSLYGWNGSYPEPSFTASTDGSSYTDTRGRAYSALHVNAADDLKLIVGASATRAESTGTSYGVSHSRSGNALSPYLGAVYDLDKQWSTYASYTSIFSPQYETDSSGQTLEPIKGHSYEAGVKGEFFDKNLNTSLALFRTSQNNTAEQAGYVGSKAYYKGIDATSQGIELEASGQLAHGLQLSASYSHLALKDDNGKDARTFIPRDMLRVASTWKVRGLEQLKLGASINWQGRTWRDESDTTRIEQRAYALLNLMASYQIDKNLTASAKLNNATNQKHLTSLYWSQSYYAAPRNGSVSLEWKL